MSGRQIKAASLIGWIRLNPTGEGYGIPLFKGSGNAPLTPETGGDLKIVRFTEFYNEDNYSISSRLPSDHERRRYRIGDCVPIPFVIGNLLRVVDAESSSDAFIQSLGELGTSKTARSIASILQSAADGSSSRSMALRATARFKLEHDEVLSGDPAHSSYWMLRLSVAIAASKLVSIDGREDARNLILDKARSWLERFSGSGDFQMLQRLLRQVRDLGAESREIQNLVFTAILRRLITENRPVGELKRLSGLSRLWIPGGLFAHYVEHGPPTGLAQSDREHVRDLADILRQAIDRDLSEPNSNLDRSLAVAAILYADRDLPSQLDDYVTHLAMSRNRELQERAASLNRRLKTNPEHKVSVREAEALLRENERVIAIYRIAHGSFRIEFEADRPDRRLGLAQGYVELLEDVRRSTNRLRGKR